MAVRYGNSGMVSLTSVYTGQEFWLNAYEIVSVCHTNPEYAETPEKARTVITTTDQQNEDDVWFATETPEAVLERIHNAKTYRK